MQSSPGHPTCTLHAPSILHGGDLVYTEPAREMTPGRWYDARLGDAPGFPEFVAAVGARGLTLRHTGCYYWLVEDLHRATAASASQVTP